MKYLRWIIGAAVAAYVLGAGLLYFSNSRAVRPAHVDAMPSVTKVDKLRLIIVGDTGLPGKARDKVRAQILVEEKDAIIAVGDLVYPHPPPCPDGRVSAADLPFYEKRVAHGVEGLRAPVYAVLGNHAYYRGPRSILSRIYPFVPSTLEAGDPGDGRVVDPAACMVDFIGQRPQIHLPSLDYGLDFGVAQIAMVDTDHLDAGATKVVDETFAKGKGWKLLIGHHVLRTYHDKESEDYVQPWLSGLEFKPDLYANGHAHLLQFGVYGDVPAVTSGTGSKVRHRPACPPACGEGQLFGVSAHGYVVVELSANELKVQFKDDNGSERYAWSRKR